MSIFRRLAPEGSRIVRVTDDAAFLRELPRATHVVTWHFLREWFARAPRLKYLATPSAGRELIAWHDAPPGVTIHFGGFHGPTMAESVVGFMLAWSHGFFRPEIHSARFGDTPPISGDTPHKNGACPHSQCGDTPHKNGACPHSQCGDTPWIENWPRAAIGGKCSLLRNSLAVIVGYGKVGRAIGSQLEAVGVKIRGFGRSNIADLPKAVQRADWLILALPSDTGTDHFLGRELIAALPRKCVVINVGRGNAVDEQALLAALRSRRLAGAYLDVFHDEPLNLPPSVGTLPANSGPVPSKSAGTVPKKVGTGPQNVGTGPQKKGSVPSGLLGMRPSELPENLVIMPHSSAFSGDYLKMCFEELKDDGFF